MILTKDKILDKMAEANFYSKCPERLYIGNKVVACKDGENIMRYYTSIFKELFFIDPDQQLYSISDLGDVNKFIDRSSWNLDDYINYVDNNCYFANADMAYEIPKINGIYMVGGSHVRKIRKDCFTKEDMALALQIANKHKITKARKAYYAEYNQKLNDTYIQTGDQAFDKALMLINK